ncbi:hypothetical protein POVWA2_001750 [Plasmodium ovale wallikeri]|uniref:Uncharacterized protein n=1 Tax=Plasmodium ovale wallikeri TaxID=864142 RepID=A0A1A8YI82_PLAOA|nr:hypothetical protein POVWA1_001860 [Plasmodium ovale wallikeri]SBT30984.1 hypothetical protein POVWA2_001750 [Plasmodium ovale wallikeri]
MLPPLPLIDTKLRNFYRKSESYYKMFIPLVHTGHDDCRNGGKRHIFQSLQVDTNLDLQRSGWKAFPNNSHLRKNARACTNQHTCSKLHPCAYTYMHMDVYTKPMLRAYPFCNNFL